MRTTSLSNRVLVDAAELLRLAKCVDDEIYLDGVAVDLRDMATNADADIDEALERTRQVGLGHVIGGGGNCCQGRHLCAYHAGWSDALDLVEDELS